MDFNIGSAKVCLPTIFEISFSCDKYIYGLLHLIIICNFTYCVISIDSHYIIKKHYSFIIFI